MASKTKLRLVYEIGDRVWVKAWVGDAIRIPLTIKTWGLRTAMVEGFINAKNTDGTYQVEVNAEMYTIEPDGMVPHNAY